MVLQQLWDGRSQQLQRITDKVIWIAQDESIGQHMNAQPSNEDRTSNDQLKEDLDGYRRAIDAFEDSLDQLFEDEVLSASSFPKDAQVLAENQQHLPKYHESQTTVLFSLKNIIHRASQLFTLQNTPESQTQNSTEASTILASEVIAKRRSLLESFRNIKQSESQNEEAQDADEFESCEGINYYHRFKELDSRFQLHCSRLPGIASWANWQQNGLDSRGSPDLDMLGKFIIFSLTIGFSAATIPRLFLGGTLLSSIITGLQISSLWVFNRQSLTELRNRRWWNISVFSLCLSMIIFFSLPILSEFSYKQGLGNYNEADVLDKKLSSAEQNFQSAVNLNPKNMKAHFWLGRVYEDLNKLELAEEEYRIAAEGGHQKALNNLARVFILNDKPDIAVSWLIYLENQNTSSDILSFFRSKNIGWALLRQEKPNFEKVDQYLQDSISFIDPDLLVNVDIVDRAMPYCFLAESLERQNRIDEAQSMWNKFKQKVSGASISDYKIETHQCVGEAEENK